MNTLDAILTRRSCREFTDKPIKSETLHQLLEAAMSGPSCVNARDWSFVVVTDPEKLAQMADANGRPAEPLRKAAAGILVCGDLDRAFRFAKDYWVIDGAIAAQNICLAAQELGLGAVWLGTWPQMDRVEAQQKLFALPETILPRVRAAMRMTGYILTSGRSAGRKRPPPFLNGSGLFVREQSVEIVTHGSGIVLLDDLYNDGAMPRLLCERPGHGVLWLSYSYAQFFRP